MMPRSLHVNLGRLPSGHLDTTQKGGGHMFSNLKARMGAVVGLGLASLASAQAFDGTELADVITTQGLLFAAGVTLVIAGVVFVVGRRAARMASR